MLENLSATVTCCQIIALDISRPSVLSPFIEQGSILENELRENGFNCNQSFLQQAHLLTSVYCLTGPIQLFKAHFFEGKK